MTAPEGPRKLWLLAIIGGGCEAAILALHHHGFARDACAHWGYGIASSVIGAAMFIGSLVANELKSPLTAGTTMAVAITWVSWITVDAWWLHILIGGLGFAIGFLQFRPSTANRRLTGG